MESFSNTFTTAGAAIAARHSDIEILAYQFWLDRGAPFGTPDLDWFRAEDELKRSARQGEAPLTALAKGIGSTLGSIAAITANVLPHASD